MSKALPRTSRLLFVLALGAAACGGGGKSSYPDASTFGTGATTGAAGGTVSTTTGGQSGTAAGGSGGVVFPGSGGTTTSTGGSSGGTPPAAGSTLLLGGSALLVRPGNACSSAPSTATAPSDVWCGVFVPSGTLNVGLLVFDATKAMAGAAITCDVGDTNCVPLNANIDPSAGNGFFGDTLVYYDAGSVYAWRPGWTAGRVLIATSSSQPAQCIGNPAGATTAICVSASGAAYAGALDTPTGAVLPMVDDLGAGSSGIAFSPDGKSVLWSTNSSTTNPAETLKMQTIGDTASTKTVAANVTGWTVSADQTRWFWLSAPSLDANGVSNGTLQTAPYPAGTAPTPIQDKVGQYALFGTKSLITVTPSAAKSTLYDVDAVADVDAPASSTSVVEAGDVAQAIAVTDAGAVLYATAAVQPSSTSSAKLYDLRAVNKDGTGKCTIDPTASADVSASFNRDGTTVEWVQVTLDASGRATAITGQVTTLADCSAHPFTTGPLYSFFDVMSGLVVQQNFDSMAQTADINYAATTATGIPGPLSLVQAKADQIIVPLFPSPGRFLFALASGSATDGIYLSPVIAAPAPALAPISRPLSANDRTRLLPVTTAKVARSVAGKAAAGLPNLIPGPISPLLPTFFEQRMLSFSRR